jgi:hypothetical protein
MTDCELNTPNHIQSTLNSGVDMLIGPASHRDLNCAEPRGAVISREAPPAAASALGTPPTKRQGHWSYVHEEARVGGVKTAIKLCLKRPVAKEEVQRCRGAEVRRCEGARAGKGEEDQVGP